MILWQMIFLSPETDFFGTIANVQGKFHYLLYSMNYKSNANYTEVSRPISEGKTRFKLLYFES